MQHSNFNKHKDSYLKVYGGHVYIISLGTDVTVAWQQ